MADCWERLLPILYLQKVVSSDHQYLVGALGHGGTHGTSELLKQTDCLITIGSTWWPEKFVPQQVPIIQVDGVMKI